MATAKKNNSAYTAAPAADKEKALATAIAQIERAYGKGSIMRMSDRHQYAGGRRPHRFPVPGLGAGHWRRCPVAVSLKSTGRSPPARPPWPCMCVAQAQKMGGEVAYHRRRTRSGSHLCPGVGCGHRLHAHLPAGHRRAGTGDHRGAGALRRHRSWWWWTRWPLWCPGQRSRGRWATASWGSTPG